MKRLIDGVTYNTETATLLAKSDYVGDWNNLASPVEGKLYQTRAGAFFIVEEIEYTPLDPDGDASAAPVRKIRFSKCSEERARQFINVGEVEVYLNPFEERVSEEETEGTIYARIPASLKRKIEEAAKAEGLSANSWAMRCFERCLSQ
jgi:predicted HicB family RNase H-like nuclease